MENWTICSVYSVQLLGNSGHMVYMVFKDTILKYRIYLITLGWFKTFIPTNNNSRANS